MTELTEVQALLRETVQRLVDDGIAGRAQQTDRDGALQEGAWSELAELGLLGIAVPEVHGGAEMDQTCQWIALEELARGCGSTAFSVFAHAILAEGILMLAGSEEQKACCLPAMASGEAVGGAAILVMDGHASGACGLTATPTDAGTRLSGSTDAFGAVSARFLVVAANDAAADGARSLFLLDRDATPFVGASWPGSLGARGADVGTITLDALAVGEGARIGPAGGADAMLGDLAADAGLALAFCSVGLARAALERSLRYANERVTFGKPIAKHEAIAMKLADMATRTETARLLVMQAAARDDRALRLMARLVASDAAVRTGYDAIQIHGGYGYSAEYEVERSWRDARFFAEVIGNADVWRREIAATLASG